MQDQTYFETKTSNLMKKTFLFISAGLLCLPILFSNCATIVSRSSYPVAVNSSPSGATVSITDKKGREVFKGSTPTAVTLKAGDGFFSKASYQVKINAPGFDEKIIPVNFKINGWYFGNILIGGVIGMLIVDPATGAMWKLDTPPIYVNLNETFKTSETPALQILDIANIPINMKRHLTPLQ